MWCAVPHIQPYVSPDLCESHVSHGVCETYVSHGLCEPYVSHGLLVMVYVSLCESWLM